jgi:hypothetical protein
VNIKSCISCGAPFHFSAGEEWKTYCISCYKQKKRNERQPHDASKPKWTEREKIVYVDRVVYKDRIVNESIPQELLKKMIRLCHPDKHGNSQSSNEITAWLLDKKQGR